jgi:putative ATP-binding cassette transporter
MKILSFISRVSPGIVVLTVIAGIISGIGSAVLLALIGSALSSRGFTGINSALLFMAVCLTVLATGVASQALLIRLSQGLTYDLRLDLCRRIISAPLRQLEETGTHRLMASLTNDIIVMTDALINLPPFCINFTTLIVCLVYLGWLSPTALGVVFGFIVVGVTIYYLLSSKAALYVKTARQQQDELMRHLLSLIEGVKELKLHRQRREIFLAEVLQQTAMTFRRHNTRGLTIYTVAGSWGQLMMFILIGLLLFALPLLNVVDTKVLSSYTLIIFYIMAPIGFLVSMFPTVARANIILEHIEQLGISLAPDSPESELPDRQLPQAPFEYLELSGVTHAYCDERDDSTFILGPIDLTFEQGEVTFLVGGNGSGKTTLAKVLVGLYVPATGEIRLNGQPITDQMREEYSQYFSVVFSDFHLFEKLLGLSAADLDTRAEDFLVQLELNHKVRVENGALSTTTALSHGQRKRLALLTAYLEDRPFYVFDEWASDQDPLFKEVFYRRLLPELKSRGKTILVISHDEKYFHLAERIIRLDYGQQVDHQLMAGLVQ